MNDYVSCYQFPIYKTLSTIEIKRYLNLKNEFWWAIVDDTRYVLNKEGEWECERMPSDRDEEFYARCRYATAQEAFAHLKAQPEMQDYEWAEK